jgi:thymidine phosphorylase
MPIAPTGDDASSRAIGHSTGLVLWQTSLIVVAIVVAVGAVAMFLVRASRHASLRHATH